MTTTNHQFRIQEAEAEQRRVVCVLGEFDARTIVEFEEHVASLGTRPLTVCIADTTIVDSSALGALIRLNTRAIEGSIGFNVHRPRDFQKHLFQVAGLDDMLPSTSECPCDHG